MKWLTRERVSERLLADLRDDDRLSRPCLEWLACGVLGPSEVEERQSCRSSAAG